MKKFSEFRDNLTSTQAALCSSALAIFVAVILGILFFYIIAPDIALAFVTAFFLAVILDVLFDMIIFESVEKRCNEQSLKARQRIISEYGLTEEIYTELRYVKEDVEYENNMKMLTAIMDDSGCKFYAKFNDEEEIELIVKNKDDNIIYSEVISDFDYFEAFFEKTC